MKNTNRDFSHDLPSTEQLKGEYRRISYQKGYVKVIRNTVFALITVAAASVLVAVLLLPILQIYGVSMTPTLSQGNIVVSIKGSQFEPGDIIAFYYNNKVLVKRVIGEPGDWINIGPDGTVYINNVELEEPYITEKAFGECDITLPYQVPESRIFVIGDKRNVSIDSRSTTIGCIAQEQIVGKIVFRVWPLQEFGPIK